MSAKLQISQDASYAASDAPERPGSVLLVDDSRAQRRILSVLLQRWGYEVVEASTGTEAIAICQARPIDIVISDWVMPGLSGPELCQQFRALLRDSYGYFILLSSKSEIGEMVHGLEVGADDFLTKPVHASELRARLSAAQRVLSMERELQEKTQIISRTLAKVQELYAAIDRDLAEARKIQESLIPCRFHQQPGAQLSLLLKPCGHIGGDLVGYFSPQPGQIGFYCIDVSGHGVTSAMMTARLAGNLSGRYLEQNLALSSDKGGFSLRPVEEVAALFNQRIVEDVGVDEYFTMVFGHADLSTGRVRLVQAGHPHPVVQRADGSVQFFGVGGAPIGLLPGMSYESFEITMAPGDRLLLYSDGFTECTGPDGQMLEESGLARMLDCTRDRSGTEILDDLFWQLRGFAGNRSLDDDVSALVLEYQGDTDA